MNTDGERGTVNIEEARDRDILVLRLSGRLDSNTSPELEERLVQVMGEGAGRLLLNFDNLEYISSAGLRVLLKTARELKAAQGLLVVCCLRDYIREVFDLSGFISIIRVAGDESQAKDLLDATAQDVEE